MLVAAVLAAVALAPSDRLTALGIDAQPLIDPIGDDAGFGDLVATPAEVRAAERALISAGAARAAAMISIFSVKESVFKAVHPRWGTWLDFEDVRVRLDPDGGFVASLIGDGPGPVSGRWLVTDGLVLSAAWC